MSMYDYPNWHEIKDLVSIYSEHEWDDAKIMVWDPINQRYLNLIFSGSSRPDREKGLPGEINFNVEPSPWTRKDEFKWWITLKKIKFKYLIGKLKK